MIPPGEWVDPDSWVKGPKSSTVRFDEAEGRARFNWQDRKRHDLKGHPRGCASCDLEPVCEGVWKGYLEIWGDREFRPVRLEDTALAPVPVEGPSHPRS